MFVDIWEEDGKNSSLVLNPYTPKLFCERNNTATMLASIDGKFRSNEVFLVGFIFAILLPLDEMVDGFVTRLLAR